MLPSDDEEEEKEGETGQTYEEYLKQLREAKKQKRDLELQQQQQGEAIDPKPEVSADDKGAAQVPPESELTATQDSEVVQTATLQQTESQAESSSANVQDSQRSEAQEGDKTGE